MYLLWRTLRFWTIIGCLIYTFTAITTHHAFNLGDWIGRHLQTASQRQMHTAALAQLRAGYLFGGLQAPPPTLLLGADDQPGSIKEYYKDAH